VLYAVNKKNRQHRREVKKDFRRKAYYLRFGDGVASYVIKPVGSNDEE